MKIFIIGGTGFLGSVLAKKLNRSGHTVTVFSRGHSINDRIEGVKYVFGDRNQPESFANTLEGNYDAVIDMVSYEPEQSRIAHRIFNGKTGRFIHCSTISVYMISNEVKIPVTEDQDDLPIMEYFARNPFGMDYGINKRKCEEFLWSVHNRNTFPVTTLRPTYIGGPKDPAKRDFFWIDRITDGKPLLIPGDGNFLFQEVYVEDAAQAFLNILENEKTIGGAYNVAQEEVFTLKQYLLELSKLFNKNPEMHFIDQKIFDSLDISYNKKGDVFPFNGRRDAVYSIEKIKMDTGYHSTPFTEWMTKTIEWFSAFKGQSVGYENRNKELEIIKQMHI